MGCSTLIELSQWAVVMGLFVRLLLPRRTITLCTIALSLIFALAVHCRLSTLQHTALVKIYNATNGPEWYAKLNWLSGDPCTDKWVGVACSTEYNSVVSSLYVSSDS